MLSYPLGIAATGCSPGKSSCSSSHRFEERGRGWADTAHATELQRADMKGEGMRTYDRNIGTETWARACSSDRIFLSSILLSKLRALFVALVVLCSVGRIGPSPPNPPIRTPHPIQAFAKDPDLTHFQLHPARMDRAFSPLVCR